MPTAPRHRPCQRSAVLMNLSYLTADFWSILFAVVLFGADLMWQSVPLPPPVPVPAPAPITAGTSWRLLSSSLASSCKRTDVAWRCLHVARYYTADLTPADRNGSASADDASMR